jgi:glucose/mannose-6-phosphate isomerase
MLDDLKKIAQVDKSDMLGFIAKQPAGLAHNFGIFNQLIESGEIKNIVFSGMGGSALVAEVVQSWLEMPVPFTISKNYNLPNWVSESTLVIVSSYSGNTEETLSSLEEAEKVGAHIAVIAHGGKLAEIAHEKQYIFANIPECPQPRTSVFFALRAVMEILIAFGVGTTGLIDELESAVEALENACTQWRADQPTSSNQAKQIAKHMLGKTPIIYGGPHTYGIAYKWKIGVNENAKNTAWANQLPEFNHNEFIGWSSHPVEKPFAVFDLISSFEHPGVLKRFEVTDRLLSGKRPAAEKIEAKGKTLLEQLLYLALLGDTTSTYLAILNNVDPTPVDLVEKFKTELTK